jgi:hypothetical protein
MRAKVCRDTPHEIINPIAQIHVRFRYFVHQFGHHSFPFREVSAGTSMSYPGKIRKIGAGDEIRTHDFNLGKVALYP